MAGAQRSMHLSRQGIAGTAIRYVAREYILSFSLSFVFFFIVFFINQILLLAEDILSKNAPLGETALLLFYSLPAVVAIAFPFAALSGALMTSARLNADNEILAFSASGISPSTLYFPFVALGVLAAVLSFAANDYFLPRGAAAFQKLYGQMVARSASMELSSYSIRRYADTLIATGPREGDAVRNLLLYETVEGSGPGATISAGSAMLEIGESGEFATLSMKDVLQLQPHESGETGISASKAREVIYKFAIREPLVGYSTTGPSEMSSAELSAAIDKKQAVLDTRINDQQESVWESRAQLVAEYERRLKALSGDSSARLDFSSLARLASSSNQASNSMPKDRSLGVYRLEYHKKFSIPAAGFFFSLLAFPLGLGTKRSGRTAGFGMALLLSTLYWGMLFAGQSAGLRIQIDPGVAMWAPNALVGAAAALAWLMRKRGARRCI